MKRPLLALAAFAVLGTAAPGDEPLQVGTFDVDASPPAGTPLAYDPTKGTQDPLHAKGIVLLGSGQPIVMVSIDWIGIGNDGQTAFKEAIAQAVGTAPDRVAVHAVHQHDAPVCDFSTARIMSEHGLEPDASLFDAAFARAVIDRTARAAAQAAGSARPASHIGTGEAQVDHVASNRRILGPDGKVRETRWTACKDAGLRAEPAGTIDPMVKLIAFYHDDEPIAALTYYACHPQSYYRTGLASSDFPGLAREARALKTKTPHIHFNGAGGNIGAGKWNDGAPENRPALTGRLADGMSRAWQAAQASRVPIAAAGVRWETIPVALPAATHLDEQSLVAVLDDTAATIETREAAAANLAWLGRCKSGQTIGVSCLALGPARILHLPGELFVEYQLAAQAMRPDLFVALAAYGDYAPGYIGTAASYYQVGYESSPRASAVSPRCEAILLDAIGRLLKD
jgi:hypothetical protein